MEQGASARGKSKTTFASTPPYLRRRIWVFLAFIALGSIASVAVPLLTMGKVRPVFYIIACGLPGIGMGAAGAILGIGIAREVKRAQSLQFRVCWNCGYHLEGLEAQGTCPECGKQYDFGQLEQRWKTAAAQRRGEKPEQQKA